MCEIVVMVEYKKITIENLSPTQKDIEEALLEGKYNIASMNYHDLAGLIKWIEGTNHLEVSFEEDVEFNYLVTYLMNIYKNTIKRDSLTPVIEELNERVSEFAEEALKEEVNVERVKEILDLRE